jgi:tryptophanyl-tRNA synthetase
MRALSGTKPTGDSLHLGNFFGALRQFVSLQNQYEDSLYFIADYHSMTSVRDGELRHRYTMNVALDYLAAGLDPERAILFRQSDIPEVCELTWILSTVTPMGMLERAHAYKAALDRSESVDHGLFSYPVLMAADILLYHADLVPVGQDQKQHIEMTRDMAQRFNHAYDCEALILPEPFILDDSATIPGTDGQKMSKSYGNTIPMFASEKKIKKAVMGIVTDSAPVEDPKDPSSPVFQLWNLFATPEEKKEMADRARAGGMGYGDIKKDLLGKILDYFAPMRERRLNYEARPEDVEQILKRGAVKAREIASPVLEACRSASGLGAIR